MADWEFVDPGTGAALGAHAYGTVAAGTSSTPWSIKLRYKDGLSGSGVNSNALVLEISEDGGATWRPAVTEFTLAITAVSNVPLDPLFTERVRTLGRGSRWALAPFRAGCAVTLSVTFSPDLRTGSALQSYSFRLGIDPNASYQSIGLIPDAPSGVLSGIGCPDVSEWITAPTLANATGKVTMGASAYVFAGLRHEIAGGDVTLSQNDSASAALAAAQEYKAVLSVGAAGTVTTTKGVKATAGTSVYPAYPAGELPLAAVTVPYGGVITTSTLLAVSGRCAVSDGGGLVVNVQPGRALVPGYLVTPPVAQTLTLVDNGTVATGLITCVAKASLVASLAATGTITCVAKANLIDGETVTISDGVNTPTVFEFDVNGTGVGGGNVQVNVSTDTTAIEVAARLHTAINGVTTTLRVTSTDPATGTLNLANDLTGAAGNVAITDTVADAGFTHTGMSGGTDGETVTIGDGVNTKVFEFDIAGDGVAGTNVQVNVSTDTTAIEVAARLHTAINGVTTGLLVTSTDNLDGTLSLASDQTGASRNVTITETVANAGFTVSGMSGGTNGSRTVRMSASGALSLTEGAILADVVTAAGDIVLPIVDRRRLLGLELLRLRQSGNETTGTAVDRVYVPYPWAVDSGAVLVRTASTGATGSTDVNVELAGTTFGSGSIAAQGTSAALTFTTFSGAAGWITLDVAAITSGGSRAVDVEVYLWIARRP